MKVKIPKDLVSVNVHFPISKLNQKLQTRIFGGNCSV